MTPKELRALMNNPAEAVGYLIPSREAGIVSSPELTLRGVPDSQSVG
jgi:hypothetical protein